MEEGLARGHSRCHQTTAEDQAEATLKEFRKPRNSLLCVVSGFYSHCINRVKELKRSLADPTIRAPELLDHKSHNVSIISKPFCNLRTFKYFQILSINLLIQSYEITSLSTDILLHFVHNLLNL